MDMRPSRLCAFAIVALAGFYLGSKWQQGRHIAATPAMPSGIIESSKPKNAVGKDTQSLPSVDSTQQDRPSQNASSSQSPSAAIVVPPRADSPDKAGVPDYPIAVSPAVAALVSPHKVPPGATRFADLHRELEFEPRDDVWAASKEFEISNYLRAKAITDGFALQMVECRTTMCEIQISSSNRMINSKWTQVIHEMREQPWGRDISGISQGAVSNSSDGSIGILTLLRRGDVR
jgi:hypothetical protein